MNALPRATLLAHPRAARHVIDPSRIVAGATAVLAYWGVWRLTRDRGLPWMAITAGVIVLASLLIPLLTR